jgi:hypothetical protein
VVPDDVQDHESVYIGQLIDLYQQRSGKMFADPIAVLQHPD